MQMSLNTSIKLPASGKRHTDEWVARAGGQTDRQTDRQIGKKKTKNNQHK